MTHNALNYSGGTFRHHNNWVSVEFGMRFNSIEVSLELCDTTLFTPVTIAELCKAKRKSYVKECF